MGWLPVSELQPISTMLEGGRDVLGLGGVSDLGSGGAPVNKF
ncbi:MAG: hypothetical protein Q8P67_02945 [archaeon]|nr:hypothetical protein [archaeon]